MHPLEKSRRWIDPGTIVIADMDTPREIFVFGSNTEGRHGKGAAKHAMIHHGAVYGHAMGMAGNSYAIVTKNISGKGPAISLADIEHDVGFFINFAHRHRHLTFNLTKIGCGLAGFKEEDIKKLFKRVPPNINLPEDWK